MVNCKMSLVRSLLLVITLSFLPFICAQAQEKEGERLFEEDSKAAREQADAQTKEALKVDRPASADFDFRAPVVERLDESNSIRGSGGVIMSRGGVQFQADTAQVNLDTKEADLNGHVLFTDPFGSLSCDSAKMNIDLETGSCINSKFLIENGGYLVRARESFKRSETVYDLDQALLTTCRCADGSKAPWNIHCSGGSIEEEGYARTSNTWIDMHGVPFFYSPYFIFPAKSERASGLLAPQFGYGSEDGLALKLPLFAVLDDSSDMTVSPFIESKTRYGSGLELRRAFSKRHNFEGRIIYSDESERDGELRGTNVSGLADPEFDEHRFGAYVEHGWRNDKEAKIPLGWSTEVHYVSDDLFLREIEDDDIGQSNANYITSQTLASAYLNDYVAAELGAEYNQALSGDDDDLVFQRVPEARIIGSKSFRPFGYNPYGFKVVPGAQALLTNFVRKEGYDGLRGDLSPGVRMPFHYKNYLTSDVTFALHETRYDLRDEDDPGSGAPLDSSQDRALFTAGWQVSTALERVFELPEKNILSTLTSLGSRNQENRLRRVKQVIEPFVKYSFVPGTDQEDLPLFDSYDRIRQRSLFSFGARTSLLGRFLPLHPGGEAITELTPMVRDLPLIGSEAALEESGLPAESDLSGNALKDVPIRKGEMREIAFLQVRESYDYTENQKDLDPNRRSWSDVAVEFGVLPSPNFALRFDSNYDAEELQFSSWGAGIDFRDDRGDRLGARYSFIDDQIGQLEGHLELVLGERLSLGYYGRFDERESEFIENAVALRVKSACSCWHVDFGFSDKLNPDREQFLVTFALGGLGDLTQDVRVGEKKG